MKTKHQFQWTKQQFDSIQSIHSLRAKLRRSILAVGNILTALFVTLCAALLLHSLTAPTWAQEPKEEYEEAIAYEEPNEYIEHDEEFYKHEEATQAEEPQEVSLDEYLPPEIYLSLYQRQAGGTLRPVSEVTPFSSPPVIRVSQLEELVFEAWAFDSNGVANTAIYGEVAYVCTDGKVHQGVLYVDDPLLDQEVPTSWDPDNHWEPEPVWYTDETYPWYRHGIVSLEDWSYGCNYQSFEGIFFAQAVNVAGQWSQTVPITIVDY